MKRIGILVCSNGLGHFRRVVQVTAALVAAIVEARVDLFCAPWQRETLARWRLVQQLQEDPRVRFQPLDPYPRWRTDAAFYQDERLLSWHRSLQPLGLDAYDLVLSDNLVEALVYQPHAVLMGSFLWHNVYSSHFGEAPGVQAYARQCTDLLSAHRPSMIANRYFAMPAVRAQTRCVDVGMLPPVSSGLVEGTLREAGLRTVLFIGGTNAPVRAMLQRGLQRNRTAAGLNLVVDKKLAADLPDVNDIAIFDYDRDSFADVDAVVARPGMGVVTDCIATQTPLFCIHASKSEMEHNTAVLEAMGLGRRVVHPEATLDEVAAFLDDPDAQRSYRAAVAAIDMQGLAQTVEAVREVLA